MTASPTDDNASLETRNRQLTKELAEAREQQVATAEILRVFSSSPTDPQRVFAEIATSAARLCNAFDSVIRRVDGDFLRHVANHGPIPAGETMPLTPVPSFIIVGLGLAPLAIAGHGGLAF